MLNNHQHGSTKKSRKELLLKNSLTKLELRDQVKIEERVTTTSHIQTIIKISIIKGIKEEVTNKIGIKHNKLMNLLRVQLNKNSKVMSEKCL